MDKLTLNGVECHCRVGVPEGEREKPQKILVDVELSLDLFPAARVDNPALGVDYWEVEKLLRQAVEGREFKLIEAMAEGVALALLRRFKLAKAVRVRVSKRPKVMPNVGSVCAEIFRRR